MAMLTIASAYRLARNTNGRGHSPHLAPAGTKREQIKGWPLKRTLSNKIKVLQMLGPGPAKSLILLKNKNDKPLKTNKTFFNLTLDIWGCNPHIIYIVKQH
jgi:hypothetical protein